MDILTIARPLVRPLARHVGGALLRFSGLNDNQRALLSRYLADWDSGGSTSAGVPINETQGLKQDVVHTAIKRIADATAMTPFPVYRRLQRGRDKAREHPVFRLLNLKANRDMTAQTWKHLTAVHLLGWGNAFSEIERNNAGQIIALNPMHPADVKIEGRAQNGELVYGWTNKEGQRFLLPASRVLHVRGLSFDGICGISPIMHLKELIGRAKAREEFQSRFYANGAVLGGMITSPDELNDEALERHRKSFQEFYGGAKNAGKWLLLEGAEKATPWGINLNDAQFVETAKLDAQRIAAAFGVPMQLLNDTETATRASTEQLFREFLMLGLNPVFANIEGEVNVTLFSEAEQATLYAEFTREALIQADTATLIAALKDEVLTAILTPNEAREKLNMNPVPGGDTLLAPVNMMPIELLGQPRSVSLNPDGTTSNVTMLPTLALPAASLERQQRSRTGRRRIIKSAKTLLRDGFERIGKRERQDVTKAVKKNLRDAKSFINFLADYYAEDAAFGKFIRKTLGPIADSLSEQIRQEIADELGTKIEDDGKDFVKAYVDILVLRYTSSSRNQLQQVVNEASGDDNPADLIEQRLTEWESGTSAENPSRADKEAAKESNRLGNALSRLFFAAGGVTLLVWRTTGDSCPLCNELDGKTIGIRERFLAAGDSVEPGGDTAPLKAESDIFAPPLHQGCDCEIVPG
jgi:HK97 family phage portal protein